MSPWADLAVAAEACKGRYALSCKPSPAIFSGDAWRPGQARDAIRKIIDQSGGCSFELVMKDISTVRYHPERMWEWAQIAMDELDAAF